MTTLQRPRWQAGLGVFVVATPAAIWILSGLVGQSLSTFEMAGMTGGLAAVVAAFTWAFGSGPEKARASSDADSLDVSVVLRLQLASPSDEKTQSGDAVESGPSETRSVTTLANSPRTASASTPGLVESLNDDLGQTLRVKRPHGLAAPIQLTHAGPAATILRGIGRSPGGLLDTEGARALVEAIDRNEVVRSEDTPHRARQLRWYGEGETIAAGGYVLRDPMVYVTDGGPDDREASCIDLRLEVGEPVEKAAGGAGFHPAYAELSPGQRAKYLCWLSSGRVGALDELGYARLFFCGLERRLLREQSDRNPILKEVVRLRETYPSSRLLVASIDHFLAFSLARQGIESINE